VSGLTACEDDTLPVSRVVIAFNVLSSPPRRFWLVLKPGM
jgi:hypothetical protein